MFIANSSDFESLELVKSFNASDNSEETNVKARIAVIVIPVLVFVLAIIGFLAVIGWKVAHWKKKSKSLIKTKTNFSEHETKIELNLRPVVNFDKLSIENKTRNFRKSKIDEFVERPRYSVQTRNFDRRKFVENRRKSSTDEDSAYSKPPRIPIQTKKLLPKGRPIKTNFRTDFKLAEYGLKVKQSRKTRMINDIHTPAMKRRRHMNSEDNSSTPYPSSYSTCKSKGRSEERRYVSPREVFLVSHLAGQTAYSESVCDCEECRKQSLESSLVPNIGSWVNTRKRHEDECACSLHNKYWTDVRPNYIVQPNRNISVDDGVVSSEEIFDLERIHSSEICQNPSTIKSAPTVFGSDESPSLHLKPVKENVTRTADVRAFSNSNCFPSAWDYMPGGFRDHENYKTRLKNLQRNQYFHAQPNVNKPYNKTRVPDNRDLRERILEDRERAQLYFVRKNKMRAAVNDGRNPYLQRNRIFHIDPPPGSYEESCCSCDSECSTCDTCDNNCESLYNYHRNYMANPRGYDYYTSEYWNDDRRRRNYCYSQNMNRDWPRQTDRCVLRNDQNEFPRTKSSHVGILKGKPPQSKHQN